MKGTSVVCSVLSASSLELIGHERSRHVSGLWSVER